MNMTCPRHGLKKQGETQEIGIIKRKTEMKKKGTQEGEIIQMKMDKVKKTGKASRVGQED